VKFNYNGVNGTSQGVCFNGISQGPFCRFGTNCHRHHPQKLSDVPAGERTAFCKLVEDTDGLAFMRGMGPQGN